ncbi:hypothetical protein PilKf_00715 [Pillotina sp. SPG140]|jgi:tetratricopeptide (TPR) repeat protein
MRRIWGEALVILFCVLFFSSQNRSLSATIHSLEQTAHTSTAPLDIKKNALIQLGKLYQLIGDFEKAAYSLADAANIDGTQRDDYALLESAFCFTAIGDMDKASAYVRIILLHSTDQTLRARARYLAACIDAFYFGIVHDLILLSQEAAYEYIRPALYYTIWKISGDEQYKRILIRDYPLSAEAHIATEQHVSQILSPLWLLFPDWNGVSID